jgi:hypothetical protein
MKINQLAAKPQLIKLVLDDADTIKDFGEPVEFYTWDRQPLDVFLRLANADQNNTATMIDIVRNLILDEDGKAIIDGDIMLPSTILVKSIAKIVELLGK